MDDGYIDTNAHLRARVSDLECELAEQCRLLGMGGEREARLMALLAESQAREAKLREALQQCDDAMGYMSEYDIPIALPDSVKAALAIPAGSIALREMVAAEREACAKVCESICDESGLGEYNRHAAAIRARSA